MRQALIAELSVPRATMAVHVTYGGYGIAGQASDTESSTGSTPSAKVTGTWSFTTVNGSETRNT